MSHGENVHLGVVILRIGNIMKELGASWYLYW
jgi:hypothetical protein